MSEGITLINLDPALLAGVFILWVFDLLITSITMEYIYKKARKVYLSWFIPDMYMPPTKAPLFDSVFYNVLYAPFWEEVVFRGFPFLFGWALFGSNALYIALFTLVCNLMWAYAHVQTLAVKFPKEILGEIKLPFIMSLLYAGAVLTLAWMVIPFFLPFVLHAIHNASAVLCTNKEISERLEEGKKFFESGEKEEATEEGGKVSIEKEVGRVAEATEARSLRHSGFRYVTINWRDD